MIPAKYFYDEYDRKARLISAAEINADYPAAVTELYRVGFLYPDGTKSERDMYYNGSGYELYSCAENALMPVKIVNNSIYFADNTHIPRSDVVTFDRQKAQELAALLLLLVTLLEKNTQK